MSQIPYSIIGQTPFCSVAGYAEYDKRTATIVFPSGLAPELAQNERVAFIEKHCVVELSAGRKHYVKFDNGIWQKDWRRVLVKQSSAKRIYAYERGESPLDGYCLLLLTNQKPDGFQPRNFIA